MVTMIVDIPMIDAYTDKSSPMMFAMISQLNQWSMGIYPQNMALYGTVPSF
jgi:hypothetical protein